MPVKYRKEKRENKKRGIRAQRSRIEAQISFHTLCSLLYAKTINFILLNAAFGSPLSEDLAGQAIINHQSKSLKAERFSNLKPPQFLPLFE
jgi:hypothetical protein